MMDEQESERMGMLAARVHQLEADNTNLKRDIERLLTRLGKQVSKDGHSTPSVSVSKEEFQEAYRKPLSNGEIKALLGATRYGPLPEPTMNRVLSTLSEVPELRIAIAAAEKRFLESLGEP
jgi:hypothetical protein